MHFFSSLSFPDGVVVFGSFSGNFLLSTLFFRIFFSFSLVFLLLFLVWICKISICIYRSSERGCEKHKSFSMFFPRFPLLPLASFYIFLIRFACRIQSDTVHHQRTHFRSEHVGFGFLDSRHGRALQREEKNEHNVDCI